MLFLPCHSSHFSNPNRKNLKQLHHPTLSSLALFCSLCALLILVRFFDPCALFSLLTGPNAALKAPPPLPSGRYACSTEGMLVARKVCLQHGATSHATAARSCKKVPSRTRLLKEAQNEEIRLRNLSHDLGRKKLLL